MAITRHGINRTNMGPLMKCSFEETVEILMDAAIYNETDHMLSVSENIIFGQMVPIGTGAFDVFMDDIKEVKGDIVEGEIAECLLDRATPVLPSNLKNELFSMASPTMLSPGGGGGLSPQAEDTPMYGDDAELEHPQTGGSMAGMPTPEVTPDEDDDGDRVGVSRSPFSPQDIGRATSPGSPGSPVGGLEEGGTPGYFSPVGGCSPGSPASPEHATTSPSYSPALAEDDLKTTSPEFDPLSPTFSARSPAYTPSTSTFVGGASRSALSGHGEEKRRRKAKLASSSPAYAPTSHKDRTTTSPAAADFDALSTRQQTSPYSPIYSPTIPSGFAVDRTTAATSPAYTPQSPGYAPTSPVYTPTSPHQAPQTSPVASPAQGDISPASDADGVAASPVIQEAPPESPGMDMITSPSYTPHIGEDEGNLFASEHGDYMPQDDFTSVGDEPLPHSVLFDQSDDEMEEQSTVE